MEAAGPLFYSFSDFELVLIAAFANQIANIRKNREAACERYVSS